VLAKSLGTTNPINMLKAAEVALKQLRRPEEVARSRGKSVDDVLPYRRPAAVEDEPAAEPAAVAVSEPVEGAEGVTEDGEATAVEAGS
jgi:Ribosomal protein S5, C-terminal domain